MLIGSSLSELCICSIKSSFQLSLTNCQLPSAIKIEIKKNTKIENKNLCLKTKG